MKKLLTLILLTIGLSGNALAEGVAYDPYEGYNRFMFGVNDRIDRHFLSPVARGYRAVTPRPVRSGIGNFFNNLRDIVSVGSNLLRLNISKAGSDLVRVGINTTFGFGGLIDIAGAAQMPNNKNTLGDTFASWGWKNSNYFVYPLLGPSTVRDALGNTIVSVYSPRKTRLRQRRRLLGRHRRENPRYPRQPARPNRRRKPSRARPLHLHPRCLHGRPRQTNRYHPARQRRRLRAQL